MPIVGIFSVAADWIYFLFWLIQEFGIKSRWRTPESPPKYPYVNTTSVPVITSSSAATMPTYGMINSESDSTVSSTTNDPDGRANAASSSRPQTSIAAAANQNGAIDSSSSSILPSQFNATSQQEDRHANLALRSAQLEPDSVMMIISK